MGEVIDEVLLEYFEAVFLDSADVKDSQGQRLAFIFSDALSPIIISHFFEHGRFELVLLGQRFSPWEHLLVVCRVYVAISPCILHYITLYSKFWEFWTLPK